MHIDAKNEFCDAQAVTATAISDVLDIRKEGDSHKPLWFVLQVDETATAVGAATVTFTLETDEAEGLDSDPQVMLSTGAIGKADLVAGTYKYVAPLPNGLQRYTGVRFTVATGPLTAGKFSAFVTDTPQTNRQM